MTTLRSHFGSSCVAPGLGAPRVVPTMVDGDEQMKALNNQISYQKKCQSRFERSGEGSDRTEQINAIRNQRDILVEQRRQARHGAVMSALGCANGKLDGIIEGQGAASDKLDAILLATQA